MLSIYKQSWNLTQTSKIIRRSKMPTNSFLPADGSRKGLRASRFWRPSILTVFSWQRKQKKQSKKNLKYETVWSHSECLSQWLTSQSHLKTSFSKNLIRKFQLQRSKNSSRFLWKGKINPRSERAQTSSRLSSIKLELILLKLYRIWVLSTKRCLTSHFWLHCISSNSSSWN